MLTLQYNCKIPTATPIVSRLRNSTRPFSIPFGAGGSKDGGSQTGNTFISQLVYYKTAKFQLQNACFRGDEFNKAIPYTA